MKPLLQSDRETEKRFNAKRQSRKVAKPVLLVQSATLDGYQPIAINDQPFPLYSVLCALSLFHSFTSSLSFTNYQSLTTNHFAPLPLCRFALKIPSAP